MHRHSLPPSASSAVGLTRRCARHSEFWLCALQESQRQQQRLQDQLLASEEATRAARDAVATARREAASLQSAAAAAQAETIALWQKVAASQDEVQGPPPSPAFRSQSEDGIVRCTAKRCSFPLQRGIDIRKGPSLSDGIVLAFIFMLKMCHVPTSVL